MKKSQKGKKEKDNASVKHIPVNQDDNDSEEFDDIIDGLPDEEEVEELQDDQAEELVENEEEKLQKELNELNDKYLRLQADFDNYRKRAFKDITSARRESQIGALEPILQVFDHFDMAVSAAESADNIDAIKEGLKMIFTEFSKALDELGIERIDAVGDDFDPNLHEAVAEEPSENIEEGKIIKQWRCGYKMGDYLIRPANVVVSSGPPE